MEEGKQAEAVVLHPPPIKRQTNKLGLGMEMNGAKRENNDVGLPNREDDFDPWTAWAYRPRTISMLLFGACLLIWSSGALDPESTAFHDRITSVKRGVCAMIVVFLAYCLLQAPSTVLIRPHPAIWRLVHGMAVIYLVALTFLLFQNRSDARQFMKFLHPDLGVELPERSYASDCRIYVPENPKSRFNNVYVFGQECALSDTLMGKPMSGLALAGSLIFSVKRTLSQFTPAHWDKDEWQPLLGPSRFVQVLSLIVAFMTVELNTFFLKFCLWIPPRNPLIVYRLVLWWLIAIPTIREYNTYLQDRKPVKKVGAFCWLSIAICIVELLICIKFGHGLYPNPMPVWLVVFWSSVGTALLFFLAIWSWQCHRRSIKKRI